MTRSGDEASTPDIAVAGPGDVRQVAALLVALEEHYLGAGRSRGLAAAMAMVETVMAGREGTLFVLGRVEGRPAALACVVRVRPGHRLQGVLWVKDLFVAAPARGQGLGRAMMAFLARYAREQGLGRIDLTTEPDNAGARRFYEELGGEQKPKVFFRFEAEALERLARGAGGEGRDD